MREMCTCDVFGSCGLSRCAFECFRQHFILIPFFFFHSFTIPANIEKSFDQISNAYAVVDVSDGGPRPIRVRARTM